MRILKLVACILAWGITAAAAEASKEIKIGGGGASCRQIFSPVRDNFERETGIDLSINATTPAQGLIELNNGHVDIVASPVPFSSMARGAARNGVIIDRGLFTVRSVGKSAVLVFIHRSNPVAALTKKQLQDIFTGRLKNWKQVGGEDLPITVVWGLATPGQNELFTRQVLEGKQVTEDAVEIFDYFEIRDKIAQTRGAIGINPQGFASASTRNPKIPSVPFEIIVVTKGKAKPEVEQLLKYIKDYSW
jgi:phosphate transport system substrate-binding protein